MNLRDGNEDRFRSIAYVDFSGDVEVYDILEAMPFVSLGLILGLLAALFALLTSFIAYQRRRVTLPTSKSNPKVKAFFGRWYLYPLVVIAFASILVYPGLFGKFASLGSLATFKDMISPNLYVQGEECTLRACDWTGGLFQGYSGALYYNLGILFLIRFVFTALTITLPFPVGLFFPSVVVGSIAGRIVGEVTRDLFGDIFLGAPVLPWSYAITGAAAFTCAFTHTLSPAVIVMEVTGAFRLFFPVMFASISANWIAGHFLPTIYDCLAYIAGLKLLPHVSHTNSDQVDNLILRTEDGDDINELSGRTAYDVRLESNDEVEFNSIVRLVSEKFNEFDQVQQSALKGMGIRPANSNEQVEDPLNKLPSIPIIISQSSVATAHAVFTALKTPILLVASVGHTTRIIGVLSRNVLAAHLLKHVVKDYYWLKWFVKV
jgi:chloride channel 2